MISSKYLDFFAKNCNERYLVLCGGRRSAKTWSTFQYLYALLSLTPLKCTVLTFSYGTMQATLEDFQRCLNLDVVGKKLGYVCELSNGSVFQFTHCDKASKALGTQCDILFINESCNLPEDVFDTYDLGARHQVILNYNPTAVAWSDKLVKEDTHNFLRTTFKDNSFLTQAQLDAFEQLRIRAEAPNASILDKYNYDVYYCGKQASASGLVYPRVRRISDAEYKAIPSDEYLGIDFGFSVDGDPTALVGTKIYEDRIYAKEYFCQKGLIEDEDIIKILKNNNNEIVCNIHEPFIPKQISQRNRRYSS